LLVVEEERFNLPVHLISPTVFIGVCVFRYFVLYICFVDSCLSFCTLYFGHRHDGQKKNDFCIIYLITFSSQNIGFLR
jgi:hypothetical protein